MAETVGYGLSEGSELLVDLSMFKAVSIDCLTCKRRRIEGDSGSGGIEDAEAAPFPLGTRASRSRKSRSLLSTQL